MHKMAVCVCVCVCVYIYIYIYIYIASEALLSFLFQNVTSQIVFFIYLSKTKTDYNVSQTIFVLNQQTHV